MSLGNVWRVPKQVIFFKQQIWAKNSKRYNLRLDPLEDEQKMQIRLKGQEQQRIEERPGLLCKTCFFSAIKHKQLHKRTENEMILDLMAEMVDNQCSADPRRRNENLTTLSSAPALHRQIADYGLKIKSDRSVHRHLVPPNEQ